MRGSLMQDGLDAGLREPHRRSKPGESCPDDMDDASPHHTNA
jgi:hypothetical protein